MKSFKDLEFKEHPHIHGQYAQMYFENGYGISVVISEMSYSNGVDTYEVAVMKNGGLCYDTHITDDILGYLSSDQVSSVMKDIKSLKGDKTRRI